ncbi:MAG: DUF4296 domain-containing protein [bacterium]|nr:MAG: DUF4296 domain-containing protein [bacterium]
MRIAISFLIFLFLFCGEKTNQPEVLKKNTFVQIYCDVVSKADFLKSTPKEAFVDSILNHYNVSRVTLENTIQSYSKNPDEWKEVFEKIVEELEKRLQQIENINRSDTTVTKKSL